MTEQLIPIFRVKDGIRAASWYARLGFRIEFEHRFSEDFPLYLGLVCRATRLHLSEHIGDANPRGLVYFHTPELDKIAIEFGAEVIEQPWARELHLEDLDGNRLRIAAIS